MKAVHIHDYGGVDVLRYEDAPVPKPGAGEVLIHVKATTINPFDCAVRAGYMGQYFNYTFPLILGTDVAGVIEQVGEGVTDVSVGDSVYTRAGIYRDGAHAEYVLAIAADVVPKPESLDWIQAAALPHVTLTAWQGLIELADLSEGQTILVHAAAGGVGHVAVQLAKWRGAKVIGTGSVNLAFLEELGVDEAIDYSTTNFEDVVNGVDVVLDLIGGETQQRSWKVLKPGGMLLSTVSPPSQEMANAHAVRQHMIGTSPPVRKVLTETAKMVENGILKPHVSSVLPLEDIRKAHEMIEARHTRGKIVLQV